MIALTIGLAVFVGMALGLLGGGGSILTVPLLAYVAGVEPRHAIAMSLLVVGVTSTIATVSHARAGRVRWRVAIPFGGAAVVGALGGGVLAQFISGTVLLVAFAVIMIAAGAAMLRDRRESGAGHERPLPVVRTVLLGITVGVISGLVGAGGGFLLVPTLALLAGLPMPIAIGTSLTVISMQSFAGLAGQLAHVHIDWRLAAFVTTAAVVGALVGGRLISFVEPRVLRRAFGWFVLGMASVILAREVDPAVGGAVGFLTILAMGMSVICRRYAHCPLDRVLPSRRADTAVA